MRFNVEATSTTVIKLNGGFMELDLGDVFLWLAFVEALSFEDFRLAMAVGVEDFALALAIGAARTSAPPARGLGGAVVISATGDGRLLLLPGPTFTYPADVTENDIVCVCPVEQARDATVASPGAQLFRALVGRGVRTCLAHRSALPHCAAEAAAAVKAKRWVEWPTPSADGMSHSGLVFSDRWRSDVCGHAAKTINSFMATLAPGVPNVENRSINNTDRSASK